MNKTDLDKRIDHLLSLKYEIELYRNEYKRDKGILVEGANGMFNFWIRSKYEEWLEEEFNNHG